MLHFFRFKFAQFAQKILLLIASTRNKLRSEKSRGVLLYLKQLVPKRATKSGVTIVGNRECWHKNTEEDKMFHDIKIIRCLKDKGTTSLFDQTCAKLIISTCQDQRCFLNINCTAAFNEKLNFK